MVEHTFVWNNNRKNEKCQTLCPFCGSLKNMLFSKDIDMESFLIQCFKSLQKRKGLNVEFSIFMVKNQTSDK